jgi:Bacteriocin-protection, YdeI or OmpD-Associated
LCFCSRASQGIDRGAGHVYRVIAAKLNHACCMLKTPYRDCTTHVFFNPTEMPHVTAEFKLSPLISYQLRKLMANKRISSGTVHAMPSDLRKVLASDKAALAAWENLTPLARNEWICWTTFVKKEETRKEHIKRVASELKKGMRRPCCWMGCIHRTDKSISPSVQAVLDRRSKKSKA